MMLQLAIDGAADGLTMEAAKEYVQNIYDSVDIIEFGTSCVYRFGMDGVREIKETFPEKKILADMKIMDGGGHMSRMGCDFGADIVTVLAVADDATIRNVIRSAHAQGKEAMVDMICVKNIQTRIIELEALEADYICVHMGVDVQKTKHANPLAELKTAKAVASHVKVAVAGGISMENIRDIVREKPDVVIVGNSLRSDSDPRRTASKMKQIMKGETENYGNEI